MPSCHPRDEEEHLLQILRRVWGGAVLPQTMVCVSPKTGCPLTVYRNSDYVTTTVPWVFHLLGSFGQLEFKVLQLLASFFLAMGYVCLQGYWYARTTRDSTYLLITDHRL